MDNLNFAEMLPIFTRLIENPEAMSALSGLLGAMNGQKGEQNAPKKEKENDSFSAFMSALGKNAQGGKRGQDGGLDQGVLNSLGVADHGKKGSNPFGTSEEIKNRICLLNAVRPYLSDLRREKLETVIKLLSLAELGTLGSLLK